MAILDLDAGENLTVTFVNRPVNAAVRVWSGASILSTMGWDDLWTNPFNWVGDVAPLPGDRLEFPDAAHQKSLHNDFVDTSFGGITFSGGGYSIAPLVPGTVTGLSGGIVNANTASDDNMLSFDVRLDAPEAVSNDRLDQKLVLTGSVDTNGYPLVVGGEGPIDLGSSASAMIGTGMLFKNGAGTTTLRGNNRYAGGTIVNQGTLVVAAAGALPSGGSLMIGTEDSEGVGAAVVLAIGLNGVAASAAPDIAAVASRSSDQRATPPHSTLAPAMAPVPVAFLPAPRAASIAVPGPLASEPMSAADGSTVCREVPVPVLSGPLSAAIPSTPRSDSILRQTQDRALQSCIAKPGAAKAWIALVEPLGPRKHARERAARTLLTVDEVLARFGQ
jgi:autotransporter-associated beta strand protein